MLCLFEAATQSGPHKGRDKDIPGYRSLGKIRVASRRCTAVPVAPPVGDTKYGLLLFTFFRPLCPAFSFADVNTYDIYSIGNVKYANTLTLYIRARNQPTTNVDPNTEKNRSRPCNIALDPSQMLINWNCDNRNNEICRSFGKPAGQTNQPNGTP